MIICSVYEVKEAFYYLIILGIVVIVGLLVKYIIDKHTALLIKEFVNTKLQYVSRHYNIHIKENEFGSIGN